MSDTRPNPERAAFEARWSNLDFTTATDCWGRQKYVHSHIEALWDGWQARAAVAPSPSAAGESVATLAKHQPCGCVVCTCEDPEQCHGCGAKHCGTHPVGEIPSPLYAAPTVQAAPIEPQPAHSKSEYKRRVTLGDPNVLPPAAGRAAEVVQAGVAPSGVNSSRGGEQ
jgi:hypothetical protein